MRHRAEGRWREAIEAYQRAEHVFGSSDAGLICASERKTLAGWLKKNRVDTILGKLRFDGANNFGDDQSKLKQVQDGKWVIVWPKEFVAPGARLLPP